MFDNIIDELDREMKSHREREEISELTKPPQKTPKPSTGAFNLEELDFEQNKSIEDEPALNQSKWADEENEADQAVGFDQYEIPDDS